MHSAIIFALESALCVMDAWRCDECAAGLSDYGKIEPPFLFKKLSSKFFKFQAGYLLNTGCLHLLLNEQILISVTV